MKKFWLGAAFSLTTLSLIWLVGIGRQISVGTPSSRWVFDAYQLKQASAEQVSGSRVLIVAGSNALFGIDSKIISEYWQRPTVNLGVNAGLGLPYILYKAKQIARPKDIIFLPMEYALFLDEGYPNAQIIDYALARDPPFLRQLNRVRQFQYVISMAPERWVQGLRKPIDSPVVEGTYGAHHLDERGDQTHTSPEEQGDAGRASVAAAKIWNYGERASKENGGWKDIQEFAEWGRANAICMVAAPTVLLRQDKYSLNLTEKNFFTTLPKKIQSLGIPYIGQPSDFMYPSNWFFDTDHHLQDWARIRHTEKLVRLLAKNPLSYCPELL